MKSVWSIFVVVALLSAPMTVWGAEKGDGMMSLGTGMSTMEEWSPVMPGSINTRFGNMLTDGFVLTFGIDILRASLEIKEEGEGDDEEYSATLVTLHGGAKVYFSDPGVNDVHFYDAFGLFTMIPLVDMDLDEVEDAVDESYDYGLYQAIGAEYFFHDDFSVGGEFGVNIFVAGYDDGLEVSGSLVDLYTAYTMNFFF